RPLTNTRSAAATARASAGVGSNTWASPSGPTRVVTTTRSPPTFFTMSPRMLKLTTTLSLPSAACAAPEARARGTRSAENRNERRCMEGSGFIVRPRDQVLAQAAVGAPEHGEDVDDAGGEHDGGARRQIDVEREQQADIA